MSPKPNGKAIALVPDKPRELSFLTRALEVLAKASTLDEVRQIHDQAEAARIYARAAAKGLEVQNQAAEIKLRSERKAGRYLAEANLHGGDRRPTPRRNKLKLSDLGITQQQSYRWQTEASVPDAVFEDYVKECTERRREMTSAAVIRLAKKSAAEPDCDTLLTPTISEVSAGIKEAIDRGRKYTCICVKPPWPQLEYRKTALKATAHGMTKFATHLKKLPIRALGSEESHLHLHTLCHSLPQALMILKHWGYAFRGALAVVNHHGSYGPYWRASCQLLILGVRGELTFRDNTTLGWIETTSEREIMEELVRVSPGPYLELFATGARPGWTTVP